MSTSMKGRCAGLIFLDLSFSKPGVLLSDTKIIKASERKMDLLFGLRDFL